MAKATGFTDGELRIMRVLWERGASTVQDIQSRLEEPLEESSIRTFLSILERKGKVTREKAGRAYVYEAAADRVTTRQRAVRQLIKRFFATPSELVLSVVDAEELSEEELARLRQALERHQSRKRK